MRSLFNSLLLLALALSVSCSDDGTVTPDKGADQGPLTDISMDQPNTFPEASAPEASMPEASMPEAGMEASAPEASVPDMAPDVTVVPDMAPDGPVNPPANENCTTPEVLTLVAGSVTTTGDTTNATNEYSTDVDCGESSFDAPQVYYKVSLTGGTVYKLILTPNGWDPALYAFPAGTTCAGADIDAACTGFASDKVGQASEVVILKPTVNDDWIIVADGWISTARGPFTLKIEEVVAPTNDTCVGPKTLAFTGTTVTETGDTTLATAEYAANVTCGTSYGMDANQLYYKVALKAGKLYKATLTPDSTWDGALYAFLASTACDYAAINTACTGHISDVYGDGKPDTVVVAPTTNQDWVFVVDSDYASDSGSFTLKIDELPVASNAICTAAAAVVFTSGAASIAGDTTVGPNEFTNQVNCGSSVTEYEGNQLYYKVTIPSGKALKMALAPQFSAYLILFQASSCGSVAGINTDCGSSGVTGTKQGSVSSGTTKTYYFQPTAPGDYIVAVDASSASYFGNFTLDLALIDVPPANQTCATAALLTLNNGTVSVMGDTFGATDQFPTLKCGGTTDFDGPQVYYKIALAAYETYKITLEPSFSTYLYGFSGTAACTPTGIETDCASNGATGGTQYVTSGSTGTIFFTAPGAGTYYLGIDSSAPTTYGSFKLTVSEFKVPTFIAPFTYSFESDCKALAATGDWECGSLNFVATSNCNSSAVPPTAGHTGTWMWGTTLNDCYSPLGNNDGSSSCTSTDTSDDSILQFKVTIPSTWTTATMTYWSWEDLWIPYDFGEIRINGTAVAAGQICSGSYTAPTAWVQRTVDLSAYKGTTATVAFHMMASTVVQYAGWYIDDLSVTGN